jgi:FAD:protein FMN transferase
VIGGFSPSNRVLGALIWIALSSVLFAQDTELVRFEYSERTMGTALKVVLYAKDKEQAAIVIDAGLNELKTRAVSINNYDRKSEVSCLSELKPNERRDLGEYLGCLLGEAFRWHSLSDGAFDVTSGPVFQTWSEARKSGKLPSEEAIRQAQSRAGWKNVSLLDEKGRPSSIAFLKEGVSINVSGIATGYLLDHMMNTFQREGIRSAMIDIGGDIILSDPPPGKAGWTIDVAGLNADEKPIAQLMLKNCGVTTSGDLNQFVEIDGIRYSHLIDPTSGQPIRGRVSATVVAKRAIDADAGATAIAVMGWGKAKERLPQMPVDEVHFLSVDGNAPTAVHHHWSRTSH